MSGFGGWVIEIDRISYSVFGSRQTQAVLADGYLSE
jgi:hypothetical protein